MTRKTASWTYEICESCLKNAHEKNKMIKELVKASHTDVEHAAEMWICPSCGSTKRL